MKFFKHFSDAHRGKSAQAIIERTGWAGLSRYWVLVELCAEKMEKDISEEFSDGHCNFEFDKRYLMRTLGFGNLLHLESYLSALCVIGVCYACAIESVIKCSMPKLLECLDRDTNRARKNPAKSKKKEKEKEKEKENILLDDAKASPSATSKKTNLFKMSSSDQILVSMPPEVVAGWNELYNREYLNREAIKMFNWLAANPQKSRRNTKGWIQFISGWLERNWGQSLRLIDSNKPDEYAELREKYKDWQ